MAATAARCSRCELQCRTPPHVAAAELTHTSEERLDEEELPHSTGDRQETQQP